MWNWLLRKLGYHVCEEFTQWTSHATNVTVTTIMNGVNLGEHERTLRWQERHCTMCGKLYQKKLKFLPSQFIPKE